MAWALQFDGVNDYAVMAAIIQLTGDFEVELKFKLGATAGTSAQVLRTQAGQNQWIGRYQSKHTLYWGGINRQAEIMLVDTDYTYIITRISNSVEWKINGASKGFAVNANDLYLRDIFKTTIGQIEYLKVTDNTIVIHNLDATASSHAAGTPVLTDTIGGNNATGVNMPTDGSAWVDLGGGGITVTVPFIGVEAVVFAPALVHPQFVTVPQVAAETAVLSFNVELGPQFLGLPLVTMETLVYSFSLAYPQTIDMDLVEAPAFAYAFYLHIPGTQVQYEGVYYYGA